MFLPHFLVGTFVNVNSVVFVIGLQTAWNIEAICTQCFNVNSNLGMIFPVPPHWATKKARAWRVLFFVGQQSVIVILVFPHVAACETRSRISGMKKY
jgi:hypothetical protein